jgi:large subunit ribosomal protein L19
MNFSRLFKRVRKKQLKHDLPVFNFGDTVRVGILIEDGNKRRVPSYQGTLISQHRSGIDSTVTIRRNFQRVCVEWVFLIHSPSVQYIKVFRRAKVRRAKLYYLRRLEGKAARLREHFLKKVLYNFFLYFRL